jgi:hypothetical protein
MKRFRMTLINKAGEDTAHYEAVAEDTVSFIRSWINAAEEDSALAYSINEAGCIRIYEDVSDPQVKFSRKVYPS